MGYPKGGAAFMIGSFDDSLCLSARGSKTDFMIDSFNDSLCLSARENRGDFMIDSFNGSLCLSARGKLTQMKTVVAYCCYCSEMS
ncbi:hypothetical protein AVEN_9165-1 [Araneus ventricosus]|uniref:Uncharacterized protein n=1 Tax=Araneus ventricosus TaxID=182803 RepID=A0A4Y2HTW4_ARAVE|nr:hypothetical protein AVEN_199891-1 [Araneus ventricosus]GBM68692.1 hypothetical protein AVEN_9165-1 [Araneus ventricosus]